MGEAKRRGTYEQWVEQARSRESEAPPLVSVARTKTRLTSPTERSLDLMRRTCDLVQKVEYWDGFAHKRRDLFGCWDLLAIRGDQTIAVQVTTRANMSSRRRKIAEADATIALRRAGWVLELHGWAKTRAGKWDVKVEDLS